MKVAVFVHGLGGGAFTNVGTTLARGFSDIGLDAELIVKTASASELDAYGDITVRQLSAKRGLSSIVPLARCLRQHRYDVLLSMPHHINFIALVSKELAQVDTTLVVSERSNLSFEHNSDHRGSLKMQAIPSLIRLLYRRADAITAPSHAILADPMFSSLIDLSRKPTAVIPNALAWGSEERMRGLPDHPWLRDRSPNDAPVLLAVGRLAPQKKFDTLIRAVAALPTRSLRPRLIILGEGPLRPDLERLVRDLGMDDQVSMPGFVKNPLPYMVASDIFILSSESEGFPSALIEAMACRCAIVSTRAVGGPSEVLTDRRNALLVDVDAVDQMTEAIEELIASPAMRTRLGDIAQEDSRAYTPRAIATQYADFFAKVRKTTTATPRLGAPRPVSE